MKRAQLWVEEEAYLRDAAESLPAGSIVVELGTAQGGSAAIFAEGTRGHGCAVYSFDVVTSRAAREQLAGTTDVRLVTQSSTEGAARWSKTCGRPVDLLFIDADHSLASVFADYHAWIRWLVPGGRVLFHDYDRPERGGASHLGVRVFVDALLGAGVLDDVEHVGRVLAARVDDPKAARITATACADAWRVIGAHVRAVRGAGGKWQDAGLDDLTRGYLILDALRERREELLAAAPDRGAFFKWEEFLAMLEHSAPGHWRDLFDGLGVEALSRLCAHELLRLAFAERMMGVR